MIDIKTESKGYVAHGVSACAGCGMELIIRNVLDVLGQDTTLVIPPGCSALFCGFGCETGIKVSAFQGNLENSAAIATGIRAGYAVQGNDHTHVVAFAGDGATLDIGLQSLSGSGTLAYGKSLLDSLCGDIKHGFPSVGNLVDPLPFFLAHPAFHEIQVLEHLFPVEF